MTEDIKSVIHISSDVGTGCKHCEAHIDGPNDFDDSVNHYIQAHGYRLLHVGSQAGSDYEGKTCHFTVAVLGHDDPPPEREPPTIEFETNLTP
jgi:hypothetical protein